MKSDTQTLIGALRVLARDIETDDGVVNVVLDEAAQRLEELDWTWLSASETLPESGMAVLAVVNDGISKPFVIRAMYADKRWCVNDNYENWMVDGEVTHWMPLPAPQSR
jgi:hypothetical protein